MPAGRDIVVVDLPFHYAKITDGTARFLRTGSSQGICGDNPKSISFSVMRMIWLFGEPYAPEENTTAHYLTRIAEGLTRGFRVSVLCGQPSYLSRGTRARSFESLNGVDVRRCRGTTLDKNVLIFRLVNMLTLGSSMFLNALFRLRHKDKVLVVTAPPSLPYIAALACRLRRVPYVLLLHDRYPQILVAIGRMRPEGASFRLLNRLNGWLYRNSEMIITVGRDMELEVGRTPGVDPQRVVTIQNWASLEEVTPESKDKNKLLGELGLRDSFVLLYAGNMGPPQDVESIVEAASMLKASGPEEIHFLFVGDGGKRKWLERETVSRGLDNISILPPRPRSDQTNFLNACDVAIVPLVKGMKGTAMPSRTYNFLAAAKPLIAVVEDGAEPAMVVEEEEVGWVVPPHQPLQLRDAILHAFQEREGLMRMAGRARRAAEEKYSPEAAIVKYLEVLGAGTSRELRTDTVSGGR